jgi:hypothetical protein
MRAGKRRSEVKVWITKYALTTGVRTYDNAVSTYSTRIIRVPGECNFFEHEWHTTEAAANARVLQMIEAKRKAIAKQLAKLDKLELELGGAK